MKKTLLSIFIVLIFTGLALADVGSEIKSLEADVAKASEIHKKLWDASLRCSKQLDGQHSDLENFKTLNKVTVLQLIASHMGFVLQSIQESILLFLAFSESPGSSQGKQIQHVLSLRRTALSDYRDQLENLSEMSELLDKQDQELCSSGMKYLESSIRKTIVFLGGKP